LKEDSTAVVKEMAAGSVTLVETERVQALLSVTTTVWKPAAKLFEVV
jgi:hypothetical protein